MNTFLSDPFHLQVNCSETNNENTHPQWDMSCCFAQVSTHEQYVHCNIRIQFLNFSNFKEESLISNGKVAG